MSKFKLLLGDNKEEKFDALLYWLSTIAELETKEFKNVEEGLEYLVNLVVDKLGSNDIKNKQEEKNFLKLVFETDEHLLNQLSKLLKINSTES